MLFRNLFVLQTLSHSLSRSRVQLLFWPRMQQYVFLEKTHKTYTILSVFTTSFTAVIFEIEDGHTMERIKRKIGKESALN